jgi:hypothetical protein
MVKAVCVDDTNFPKEIPLEKRLKLGQEYTILYTLTVLPSREIACDIAEIDLDETCDPYKFYALRRFRFTKDEFLKLAQLMKDCTDADFSLEELMDQIKLVEQDI